MQALVQRLKRDERGATAVEYGLLASLFALFILAGIGVAFDAIAAQWTWVAERMNSAFSGG